MNLVRKSIMFTFVIKNRISYKKSLVGKTPIFNLAARQRKSEIIMLVEQTKFACGASHFLTR